MRPMHVPLSPPQQLGGGGPDADDQRGKRRRVSDQPPAAAHTRPQQHHHHQQQQQQQQQQHFRVETPQFALLELIEALRAQLSPNPWDAVVGGGGGGVVGAVAPAQALQPAPQQGSRKRARDDGNAAGSAFAAARPFHAHTHAHHHHNDWASEAGEERAQGARPERCNSDPGGMADDSLVVECTQRLHEDVCQARRACGMAVACGDRVEMARLLQELERLRVLYRVDRGASLLPQAHPQHQQHQHQHQQHQQHQHQQMLFLLQQSQQSQQPPGSPFSLFPPGCPRP